jgi:hypothetical protein
MGDSRATQQDIRYIANSILPYLLLVGSVYDHSNLDLAKLYANVNDLEMAFS